MLVLLNSRYDRLTTCYMNSLNSSLLQSPYVNIYQCGRCCIVAAFGFSLVLVVVVINTSRKYLCKMLIFLYTVFLRTLHRSDFVVDC